MTKKNYNRPLFKIRDPKTGKYVLSSDKKIDTVNISLGYINGSALALSFCSQENNNVKENSKGYD